MNYYETLGVDEGATLDEISKAYKKLLKENHPDRFEGLKAKYEKEGDEFLLEVIEEKVRKAEEFCKLLNEAYQILSDPERREEYDSDLENSGVGGANPPEIVLNLSTLDFGIVQEGQRKKKTFVIENKGGYAESININWESKPDWAEDLVITPDPNTVFPIEVEVVLDTHGIPPGFQEASVVVEVEDSSHGVRVFYDLQQPAGKSPAFSKKNPTNRPDRSTALGLGCIATIILLGLAVFASSITGNADGREAPQANAASTEEFRTNLELLQKELEDQVLVQEVKRYSCETVQECAGSFQGKVWLEFTVKNAMPRWVDFVLTNAQGRLYCAWSPGDSPGHFVTDGERRTYKCSESSVTWNNEIGEYVGSEQFSELCIRFQTRGVEVHKQICSEINPTQLDRGDREEVLNNVRIESVGLIPYGFIDGRCSPEKDPDWHWEACSKPNEGVEYVIVNGSGRVVEVSLGWHARQKHEGEPWMSPVALQPGERYQVFQRLPLDPECLTFEVAGMQAWQLCPLNQLES